VPPAARAGVAPVVDERHAAGHRAAEGRVGRRHPRRQRRLALRLAPRTADGTLFAPLDPLRRLVVGPGHLVALLGERRVGVGGGRFAGATGAGGVEERRGQRDSAEHGPKGTHGARTVTVMEP
jgi:hypothetical protein